MDSIRKVNNGHFNLQLGMKYDFCMLEYLVLVMRF